MLSIRPPKTASPNRPTFSRRGAGGAHRLSASRSFAMICALLLSIVVAITAPPLVAAAPATGYTAVTPARLLDTRPGGSTIDGVGAISGAVGPSATIDVVVSGRGGIPATGATAVAINVTAVAPTASGFTTVFPSGEPRPNASTLNWVNGDVVPNFALLKIGTGGKISIYNSAGSTNYLVDVVGWTADGVYTPLSPGRLLDTRTGGQTIDGQFAATGSVGATQTTTIAIRGRGGVPADANTVALNVTAINPTTDGYTTIYPSGETKPNASNLNWKAERVVPNAVVVKLGSNGAISLFNSSGATHYLIDVVGWFASDPSFTPLSPRRLVDTRVGGQTSDGLETGNDRLAAGQGQDFQVTGRSGIPAGGVGAVILNITAVSPSRDGYATVWPTGMPLPNSSNLNFTAERDIPNLVITQVGSGGRISVYNFGGFTDYVVDVVGWFAGITPPDTTTLPRVNAVKIAANGIGSCAILDDTTVRCWGNQYMTGGIGSSTPVAMPELTGATAIALGFNFGCAVRAGRVLCWGRNDYGQLGNTTASATNSAPGQVAGVSNAVAITASDFTACALLADASVKCWGLGDLGQIGNGARTSVSSPTSVLVGSAIGIFGAFDMECVTRSDLSVYCWGGMPVGTTLAAVPTPRAYPSLATATQLAMGDTHVCGLMPDGTVKCLGGNLYGQLGNGTTSTAIAANASQVPGLSGASAISGMDYGVCAFGGGGVKCWGDNFYGSLGNGTEIDSSTPVAVIGVSSAAAISSGTLHACALTSAGGIGCWGTGVFGELGNRTNRNSSHVVEVDRIGPPSGQSADPGQIAADPPSGAAGRNYDRPSTRTKWPAVARSRMAFGSA